MRGRAGGVRDFMEIQIRTNASGELYLEDDTGRMTRLYRFREALRIAGISAATYYAWVTRGLIADARLRDRGQWRVFSEPELDRLIRLSRKVQSDAAGWRVPAPRNGNHASGDGYNWREVQ